jgi:hypothetical protein
MSRRLCARSLRRSRTATRRAPPSLRARTPMRAGNRSSSAFSTVIVGIGVPVVDGRGGRITRAFPRAARQSRRRGALALSPGTDSAARASMRQRGCKASRHDRERSSAIAVRARGAAAAGPSAGRSRGTSGVVAACAVARVVDSGEFSAQLVGQPLFLVAADGSVAEFPGHQEGYAAFEAAAGLTSG